MTSDRQRRANLRNAQRSTGPKTPAGRVKASGNARTHGLSAPLDVDPVQYEALVQLLRESDLLDVPVAEQVALRVLKFERTLAYQRQQWRVEGSDQIPVDFKVPEPGETADTDLVIRMLHSLLADAEDEAYPSGESPAWYREALGIFSQVQREERRDAVREVRAANRYSRRSANQLIKTLRKL